MQLSYRQECFTGKYTTRKILTKLHPGPKRRIFHNLTGEDIDDVISRFFTLFVQTVSEKWRAIDLSIQNKRTLHGGLNIFCLFLKHLSQLHKKIMGLKTSYINKSST